MIAKVVIIFAPIFMIAGFVSANSNPEQKYEILSPLSDKSQEIVLGENITKEPTNTPTLTPSGPEALSGRRPTPTLTLTPTPIPTYTPTLSPSPTPTPIPVILTSSELENLFSKYANQYSVDKEVLKKIAKCESNFNTNAVFKDYAGLFQFATSSWISTRNLMGQDNNPGLRTNADEAIKTAAFKISRGELNAWPNCNK